MKKMESGAKRRPPKPGAGIAAEERHRMIAEAAYYRALANGFGGDPLDDWLAAEREVSERLAGPARRKSPHAA